MVVLAFLVVHRANDCGGGGCPGFNVYCRECTPGNTCDGTNQVACPKGSYKDYTSSGGNIVVPQAKLPIVQIKQAPVRTYVFSSTVRY